jgi:hypothetical protein
MKEKKMLKPFNNNDLPTIPDRIVCRMLEASFRLQSHAYYWCEYTNSDRIEILNEIISICESSKKLLESEGN